MVRRNRIAVLTAAALLFGLGGIGRTNAQTRKPASLRMAPDFSREDLNHRTVTLAALRGKVVLLNFWATWCEPCLNEVPRFAAWQEQYRSRGLQIMGVSMDDDEPPVAAFYREHKLNYPVVMGDEKMGELYGGVLGLPVTFLIDRTGKIRFRHDGETPLNLIEGEVRKLLAER
ncbi:MAG TPA: TlpA disulfide reductase family protein [Bryobacteraceae bacterium]|nr:TlpA disulfide reductase family protein [Bryobacteraceae bacterium]